MGCRGCSETEALRKANRVVEAALDGALGVLAGVQNLLTERAIDPTPFGSKEEETLSAVAQLIKKYVQEDVSRETQSEETEHVQEEVAVAPTERNPPVRRPNGGQVARAGDSEVNRTGPHGLGLGVQSVGRGGVRVPRRTLGTRD